MNKNHSESGEGEIAIVFGIVMLVFILGGLTFAGMWGCPKYNVYSQRMEGEAILAHAHSSREVAVAEAKAKMESASLLADAEIARAKGVAQANKIIGDSLRNNEEYLRYLWITDVAGASVDKTVVYVPTETNLPILEAGRNLPFAQKK